MPRTHRRTEDPPRNRKSSRIVDDLADELKSESKSGQPRIDELEFITGLIRVVVLWDRWHEMSHEDRSAAILDAYRIAETKEFADRITLATGLTFPEAQALGMLPFQIIAPLRRNDPVTLDQCHQAMIDEGASTLAPGRPQLWFATEEEADACFRRLSERLSGSEPVWYIQKDLGQGGVMEWDAAQ